MDIHIQLKERVWYTFFKDTFHITYYHFLRMEMLCRYFLPLYSTWHNLIPWRTKLLEETNFPLRTKPCHTSMKFIWDTQQEASNVEWCISKPKLLPWIRIYTANKIQIMLWVGTLFSNLIFNHVLWQHWYVVTLNYKVVWIVLSLYLFPIANEKRKM